MSSCFVPCGFLAFSTLHTVSYNCLHGFRITNYTVTLEERNRYSTELWDLVSSGALKINVHTEYSFSAKGVRQAHIDLTMGKTTGKLLIKVAD
jgi:NADPH:quinone reductase-like Zn-dependent oxidoreductase